MLWKKGMSGANIFIEWKNDSAFQVKKISQKILQLHGVMYNKTMWVYNNTVKVTFSKIDGFN